MKNIGKHIDGAVAEKVVRLGHSVQGNPETILEVKRILLEHSNTSAQAAKRVSQQLE